MQEAPGNGLSFRLMPTGAVFSHACIMVKPQRLGAASCVQCVSDTSEKVLMVVSAWFTLQGLEMHLSTRDSPVCMAKRQKCYISGG